MTFDLTPDQRSARDRARTYAVRAVAPIADEVDRTAVVHAGVVDEAAALLNGLDLVGRVGALEEIARCSGSVAMSAHAVAYRTDRLTGLSGLRGAMVPLPGPDANLGLTAVALGLGRAALDIALSALAADRSDAHEQGGKPHWIVADVATELDAARLLTMRAALVLTGGGGGVSGDVVSPDAQAAAVSVARLLAGRAAQHAIDVALRIVGAEGYGVGSTLDRLSRDIRAVQLVLGGEEQQRATAAVGLLPG
jgi:hypothetical protein